MTRTAALAGALVLAMATAAFAQAAPDRQSRRQRGPQARPADASRLTNDQLVSEIKALKARIAKLEASQAARVKTAPKADRTAKMGERDSREEILKAFRLVRFGNVSILERFALEPLSRELVNGCEAFKGPKQESAPKVT